MEIQGIQRITQHKAFEKELRRLGKKYRTIPEDLHTFIDVSVRAVHLLGRNLKIWDTFRFRVSVLKTTVVSSRKGLHAKV